MVEYIAGHESMDTPPRRMLDMNIKSVDHQRMQLGNVSLNP